jgi:hypothetical protein
MARAEGASLAQVLREMGSPEAVAAEWAEGLSLAELEPPSVAKRRVPPWIRWGALVAGLAILVGGVLIAQRQARLKGEFAASERERALIAAKLNSAIDHDLQSKPSPFIPKEAALAIGRTVDASANWEAYLREDQFDVTLQGKHLVAPLWSVEAKDAAGRYQILYLDAKTGQELQRLTVESPQKDPALSTPQGAVERYFALTAAGRWQEAWSLLHPESQKPNPNASYGSSLAWFWAQEGKPGPTLKAISSVTPVPFKFWMCMCQVPDTVLVTATLADGNEAKFHAAPDKDGSWRLFWAPNDGLQ